MKKIFTLVLAVSGLLFSISSSAQNNVGIGTTTPDASAALEVLSSDKGMLVPRMTAVERQAIPSPANGLLVYDLDSMCFLFYKQPIVKWINLCNEGSDTDWSYFSGSANTGEIYHAGDVALGSFTDPDGHGINVQTYSSGKGAVRGVDQSGLNLYAEGLLGVLSPASSYELPVNIVNAGVLGYKPALGGSGASIVGINKDDNSSNYGGLFSARGNNTGINYGIYSVADSAATNWAGYFVGNQYTSGQVKIENGDEAALNTDGYLQIGSTSGSNIVIDDNEIAARNNADTSALFLQPNQGTVHIGNTSTLAGYKLWVTSDDADEHPARFQVGGSTKFMVNGNGGTTIGTFNNDAPTNGLYVAGDVTIGVSDANKASGYKLSVDGNIICEEVLIQNSSAWPDYVFDEEYDLLSIEEVKKYIKNNKHLPGVPSAESVESEGISMGDMSKVLMRKMEELTLYIIQQQEEIEELKKVNAELVKAISK